MKQVPSSPKGFFSERASWDAEPRDPTVSWRHWVVVLLLAVLAIFVLQNTHVVEVRFLFWKIQMSRALVLLGVLAAGVGTGWLGALVLRPKR